MYMSEADILRFDYDLSLLSVLLGNCGLTIYYVLSPLFIGRLSLRL